MMYIVLLIENVKSKEKKIDILSIMKNEVNLKQGCTDPG